MMSILKNFDIAIIKAPKEGIMGLDSKGGLIILRDGDMVSLKTLDEQFASLLYIRGMLKPYKINENIKPKDSIVYKKHNRKRRGNRVSLDSWLNIKKK